MDDLHKVEISLDSAIKSHERRESEAHTPASYVGRKSPSFKFDPPPTPREDEVDPDSFRGKVSKIINHHHFHMAIVALVILDVLFVLAELLIDLKFVEGPGESHNSETQSTATKEEHNAPKVGHAMEEHGSPAYIASSVFHYLSMSVLCVFLIEYVFKIYVMHMAFFHHCLEIFDLIVVVVSLILESVFHHSHSIAAGTGLLVLLRLWRVTRIVNGIVLSVKIRAREKLEAEREERRGVEEKLVKAEERIAVLKSELRALSIAVQKTVNPQQKAALNKLVSQELANMNNNL